MWRRIAAHKKQVQQVPPDQVFSKHQDELFDGDLQKTIKFFEETLGMNDDFVIREIRVFGQYPAAVMYFSNLVNREVIAEDILKALMSGPTHIDGKKLKSRELKDVLIKDTIFFGELFLEHRLVKMAEAFFRGDTVVLVQGLDEAIQISTRNVEQRSVSQPQTEQVIRGGRDGLIESLATNITLLRYRLQTPNFRIKILTVGQLTKTKVAICYIEGITMPALVQEVEDRIAAINIDGVLDAGYLEQFIEDNHWSPFPQIQNTERPDKCVANLLEGRVVILTDGTPFTLIAPAVFSQFYQTVDDYTERPLMGSLVRLVRVVALTFSLIFPALYVAVIAFSPDLIPTKFAVAVAGGRAGVPFPAVIEVLLMQVSMEVLREATLRLPQQVGGALSIVGVLVIGQAAVSAGFASPITVVVIALTTIGSFATPAYNVATSLRILQFFFTILSGIFGLYGVMLGLILVTHHMLTLRSFGVPYLSPFVPGDWQGLKDLLIRAPLWWMSKRPKQLHPQNPERLGRETMDHFVQQPSHTLDPVHPRKLR
ncbi:spore germination protein [Alicyclobacillus fastidiosus]|uniref:Spore germination protein n=1 Tax=Alicyclobacillus fastidiosus TaxID=392011 RepID=A0ABV5AK08_9BACL|nr:spore germination protein [Alicyclobacillus fastidiosus]WEH11025.1 spore germination protein [Alicyclobacillus fastidiosus]